MVVRRMLVVVVVPCTVVLELELVELVDVEVVVVLSQTTVDASSSSQPPPASQQRLYCRLSSRWTEFRLDCAVPSREQVFWRIRQMESRQLARQSAVAQRSLAQRASHFR